MIAILATCEPRHAAKTEKLAQQALGPDVIVRMNATVADLPLKAKVWMAGGSEAVGMFKRAGLLGTGRNRAMKWYRGQAFQHPENPDIHVTVGATPDSIRYDLAAFSVLRNDVFLARRLAATGTMAAKLGRYEWASDLSAVVSYVESAYRATGKPVPVSLDLETEGLHPFDPEKRILTVAASAIEGAGEVVDVRDVSRETLDRIIAQVTFLLTSSKVHMVGANLKFDLLWLRVKWGVRTSRYGFDTCQGGSILDEVRSNSLSNHTFEYAPDLAAYDYPLEREYDKSRMDLVPPHDLLPYAAGDVDAALRCYRVQRDQIVSLSRTPTGGIAKRSLASLYRHIIQPTQMLVHEIEHVGVHVDLPRFHALGAEWAAEIVELRAAAAKMLPTGIVKKHEFEFAPDGRPLASLSTPQLVIDFMFSPLGLNLEAVEKSAKKGVPAVSAMHLSMFASHPDAGPFVACYLAYAKIAKIHSTYYEGFLKHLRADGCWHATYATHRAGDDDSGGPAGTVSGRGSANDPAMQTMPKHGPLAKALRNCVVAPEGYVILSRDYSQGELKVTACWAGEPTMVKAYQDGKDLHVLTPASIRGVSYEEAVGWKDSDPEAFGALRKTGKPANFGLIYGLRENGFMHYAKALFGLDLNLDEATTIRSGFFDLYSELLNWHERQVYEAETRGFVESPFGRRRHLPLILSDDRKIAGHERNKAINFPIQSCLGDMMWWAMSRCLAEMPWLLPFGQIHDNGLWYCPVDRVSEALERSGEVMENLPFDECFGWRPELKFTSDAEVGERLGSLKGVE